MKIRYFAIAMTVALVLSTFSGCGLREIEARLDAVENAVENRADVVEEKVENTVEAAVYGSAGDKDSRRKPDTPMKKDSAKADSGRHEPALTVDEAEKLALEHAGLTAEQVRHIRTAYEIDDGIRQYDVQFRMDRVEYEYEIHADSGDILSFDKDR